MKNFLDDSGIKPKIIDYGEDTIDIKYRGMENKNQVYADKIELDKKKKNKE